MYVSRPSMLAFSYRLSGLSLPSLTGALRRLVGVASPAAGTGIDERGARGGQRNEHGGVPVGDGDKFGRLRVGSLEKVFQPAPRNTRKVAVPLSLGGVWG